MKIFEEKIQTYKFITALVGITLAVLVFVVLKTWNDPEFTILLKIILFAVLFLELFVFVNFQTLKIVCQDGYLIFGFGVFKKKIKVADIESIETAEYAFRNYGGYGIRIGRDKTVGYVPRSGQGLKIKVKNYKKIFFVTTKKAEQLKNILSLNNDQ